MQVYWQYQSKLEKTLQYCLFVQLYRINEKNEEKNLTLKTHFLQFLAKKLLFLGKKCNKSPFTSLILKNKGIPRPIGCSVSIKAKQRYKKKWILGHKDSFWLQFCCKMSIFRWSWNHLRRSSGWHFRFLRGVLGFFL